MRRGCSGSRTGREPNSSLKITSTQRFKSFFQGSSQLARRYKVRPATFKLSGRCREKPKSGKIKWYQLDGRRGGGGGGAAITATKNAPINCILKIMSGRSRWNKTTDFPPRGHHDTKRIFVFFWKLHNIKFGSQGRKFTLCAFVTNSQHWRKLPPPGNEKRSNLLDKTRENKAVVFSFSSSQADAICSVLKVEEIYI